MAGVSGAHDSRFNASTLANTQATDSLHPAEAAATLVFNSYPDANLPKELAEERPVASAHCEAFLHELMRQLGHPILLLPKETQAVSGRKRIIDGSSGGGHACSC